MNLIAWQDFEPSYYNVAVHNVNYNTTNFHYLYMGWHAVKNNQYKKLFKE